MIRVMIAEDHALVRAGLEELLESHDDMEIVGLTENGAEAVVLAAEITPDVILMDLSMPVMDGIEATRQIMGADPAARVVILTSFADRDQILGALDAGALGYLLKDAEPDELYRGIRAVAEGDSPLAPKVARALLSARAQERPVASELTGRERDVLALVGSGLPNKLVAMRLGISEKTVKAHLTSVFRAIGVTDRTQAALWAQRHGMLPVE
jgi:DNA-binding NarL/FixJ family response regulator